MVVSGATACTVSVSSTSSTPASHGEADEPVKAVMTWIRAGGSPNRLTKSARSCRMSVTGWGRTGRAATASEVLPSCWHHEQEVRDKLRALHAELNVGLQPSAGYTDRAAVEDWLEHGLSRSVRTIQLYRDGVKP
jgi:hypothetical protein